MHKSRLDDGRVLVEFGLPAVVTATSVSVCGDFNGWSPDQHPLMRGADGGFHAAVTLPAGRRWRFRYLLDGVRWENDWAADDYVPNGHGSDDSVVDLTALAGGAAAEPAAESAEPVAESAQRPARRRRPWWKWWGRRSDRLATVSP